MGDDDNAATPHPPPHPLGGRAAGRM